LCSSCREIELDDGDEPIRRHELYDARDVVPAAAQWSTTLWKFGISVGLCALRVSTVAHARTRATERCGAGSFTDRTSRGCPSGSRGRVGIAPAARCPAGRRPRRAVHVLSSEDLERKP
jgi:hypothetical protein